MVIPKCYKSDDGGASCAFAGHLTANVRTEK